MTTSSSRIRERIRNTSLVKEQDPRRWREVSLFLAMLVVLSMPVLFDISQQTRYVRTRYAVEKLRGEKTDLEQQYLRLRIERASLESLERVSRRAIEEMGLIPARSGVRVVAPRVLRAGSGAIDPTAPPDRVALSRAVAGPTLALRAATGGDS